MKTAMLLLIVLVGALALNELEIKKKWAEFKVKYGKTYPFAEEELKRLHIFRQNLLEYVHHNKLYDVGEELYKEDVNKYSDMTDSEFLEYLHHSVEANVPAPASTA